MFKPKIVLLVAALALILMLASAVPTFAADEVNGDGVDAAAGQHIPWADFQGEPAGWAGQIGVSTGYYVWNENAGGANTLKIRVTADGSAHVFSGRVLTGADGNMWNPTQVSPDPTDKVQSLAYNTVFFSLRATTGGNGVDIPWSSQYLQLNLFIDNVKQPALVHYGAAGTAATALPLIVDTGKSGLLTLSMTMLDGPTGFTPRVADGLWLYRDPGTANIHLRGTTVSTKDVKRYTGTFYADDTGGTISSVSLYKPDKFDSFKVKNGNRLTFTLVTKGYEDGVDFTLGGSTMIVTLRINNRPAAPRVSLGSNPFNTIYALTFRMVP
jgi:hypothetical protein